VYTEKFSVNYLFFKVSLKQPYAFHKNDTTEIQIICSVTIHSLDMVSIGGSQSIHYKMKLKIISHAGKCCGKISEQSLFIKVRNLSVRHTFYLVCFDRFALCSNLTTR